VSENANDTFPKAYPTWEQTLSTQNMRETS